MARFLARAAALVLVCALAFWYANHVPAVVPASAPATEFSAERAMTHVAAIAARPHPMGSEENRQVADYLVAQLRALGLEPQIQATTGIGTRYAAAGHVRNVLARLPGSSGRGKAILLMAHYDAVPAAPGAGDDASGSSVLLETLRALRAGPAPVHDVIALFADGEEAGLLGAAAFVSEHPWAKDVEVTMNFEARGTRGPSLMFETGEGNLDVVRVLRRAGGARATSLSTAVYRKLPNDTDLSETARLGKPALNFAFIGGVNRYHTAQDDLAHLDPRSVQDHGNSALAMARELAGVGGAAAAPLPRPRTGDAVFFDLPLVGLVVYPEGWAPLFALLILVPLGYAMVVLRRREPRWLRGVLLGAGGAIATTALAVVLAILTANALRALHGAIGSGTPTQSGVYVAAVALLAFALAGAVHALLRRWAPARALWCGGVALHAAIAIVTAFMAPGVSFVFVWPALCVAAALALWAWRERLDEPARWVATLLAVMVVLPITWLMGAVALGLDATGAAVVAVFTALGSWLLAHALELWTDRPWRAPAAAGGAAVLLLLVGAATVRTSDEHPVGAWIGYGISADTNLAFLGVNATSRGALDTLRAQLGAAAAGARAPSWFTRYFALWRAAPAPTAVPIMQGNILRDSVIGDERHLVVQLLPPARTRAVSLRADSGMVRQSAFDGRLVDTSRFRYRFRGRWSMEYLAPQGTGFTLGLTVPRDRPLRLHVTHHLAGIPRVPGLELPQRPSGVIPIQRGDFTLIQQTLVFPPAARPGSPNRE